MTLLGNTLRIIVAIGALTLGATASFGQSLLGSSMTFYWRAGNNSNFALNSALDTRTFTVGSGVDVSQTFFSSADVDVSASQIVIDFTAAGGPFASGVVFNGAQFTLNDLGQSFTSASIDPATSFAGFDSSRISITNGELFLDFKSLAFTSASIAVINVNASAVPEPSTYAAAVGVLALGFVTWRRSRRVVA